MKSGVLGLLIAVLSAAGLAVATGGSAAAACPVYTGCFDTRTIAKAPGSVRKGDRVAVCAKVKTVGNAKPRGRLRFKISRDRGGFAVTKRVRYAGGTRCVRSAKLRKRGRYTVKVSFIPRSGSVWNPSRDSDAFKVV